MKIEYIREFLSLVETMNFSITARTVFISQPTLSRHIQAMEKELGTALFNTTSHGISLTKQGEMAIAHFRKIVREYDRFLERCDNLFTQVSGTLRIGILYYSMDEFFSEFLEQLKEKYPNVNFLVSNYQPQPLYDDLWSGKIDVASLIFFDLQKHNDLRLQKIGTQGVVAILNKDHPLSSESDINLKDLLDLDLISLKNDLHSNEITEELFTIQKVRFNTIRYTDNIETVPAAIRKSGGVHITGESCKKQNASGVVYKDISGANSRGSFCLAALPDNDNPLIDLLLEEAKEFYKLETRKIP